MQQSAARQVESEPLSAREEAEEPSGLSEEAGFEPENARLHLWRRCSPSCEALVAPQEAPGEVWLRATPLEAFREGEESRELLRAEDARRRPRAEVAEGGRDEETLQLWTRAAHMQREMRLQTCAARRCALLQAQ